jgi:hypothetical protein
MQAVPITSRGFHARVMAATVGARNGAAPPIIFTVVSILRIADRTRGTGRFNLAAGSLAAIVDIGAP